MVELFVISAASPYPSRPSSTYALPASTEHVNRMPALADSAQAFLLFLGCVIAGAFCIALITAALMHFFKPGLVVVSRRRIVIAWARGRLAAVRPVAQLPNWFVFSAHEFGWRDHPKHLLREIERMLMPVEAPHSGGWSVTQLKEFAGISLDRGAAPDDLFMHVMQSEARMALAHPTLNPSFFALLSADAPIEARSLVVAGDIIAGSGSNESDAASEASEERAGSDRKLPKEKQERFAAAMASADHALSQTAENALDELQLRLMSGGIWTYRVFALAIGTALGSGVAALLGFGEVALLVFTAVGAFGGLLSSLVSDGFSALIGRFSR